MRILNSTENYGRRCLTPLSPRRNYILSVYHKRNNITSLWLPLIGFRYPSDRLWNQTSLIAAAKTYQNWCVKLQNWWLKVWPKSIVILYCVFLSKCLTREFTCCLLIVNFNSKFTFAHFKVCFFALLYFRNLLGYWLLVDYSDYQVSSIFSWILTFSCHTVLFDGLLHTVKCRNSSRKIGNW